MGRAALGAAVSLLGAAALEVLPEATSGSLEATDPTQAAGDAPTALEFGAADPRGSTEAADPTPATGGAPAALEFGAVEPRDSALGTSGVVATGLGAAGTGVKSISGGGPSPPFSFGAGARDVRESDVGGVRLRYADQLRTAISARQAATGP